MNYIFWGIFVIYGMILLGYLVWMYVVERAEGGK